jgi:hypothetical protein
VGEPFSLSRPGGSDVFAAPPLLLASESFKAWGRVAAAVCRLLGRGCHVIVDVCPARNGRPGSNLLLHPSASRSWTPDAMGGGTGSPDDDPKYHRSKSQRSLLQWCALSPMASPGSQGSLRAVRVAECVWLLADTQLCDRSTTTYPLSAVTAASTRDAVGFRAAAWC